MSLLQVLAILAIPLTLLYYVIGIILRWIGNGSSERIHPLQEVAVRQTRLRRSANTSYNSRRAANVDDVCPICLDQPEEAIETNCGHVFCSMCLFSYWTYGSSQDSPIICPTCRQQVTILLSDQQSADIDSYNRRFSTASLSIAEYLNDLPTLLRHCCREFFAGNMSVMFGLGLLARAIFALIYTLSPIDFIPEALFGILGFVDDIVIVLMTLISVTTAYRGFVANRGLRS